MVSKEMHKGVKIDSLDKLIIETSYMQGTMLSLVTGGNMLLGGHGH